MVDVVPALTEGVPMAPVTLPEAQGGGDDGITYSVSPMVPGLSFNPSSRVLSGTPTVTGTYPVTYTATTGDEKASLSFTVEVQSSLMGSWASSGDWWDDDQIVGVYRQTLTFTKSRYIQHRTNYRTGASTAESRWVWSGTWEATDTTITRIWLDDHDDDEGTPIIERRVRKHYLWSENRDVLCVQYWGNDHEELDDSGCTRYERMPRPAPADLLGTWTEIQDDAQWRRTIEISPTEFKFTVEYLEAELGEEEYFVLIGTYEVIPAELFVLVTVTDALEDGVSLLSDPDDPWKAGVWSRWAFAPTAVPNRLAVSNHWAETNPNPDGPGFIDGDDLPYGGYSQVFEKQ